MVDQMQLVDIKTSVEYGFIAFSPFFSKMRIFLSDVKLYKGSTQIPIVNRKMDLH